MYGFLSTLSLLDVLRLQMYFITDWIFHQGTAVKLGKRAHRASGSREEIISRMYSKWLKLQAQMNNPPLHHMKELCGFVSFIKSICEVLPTETNVPFTMYWKCCTITAIKKILSTGCTALYCSDLLGQGYRTVPARLEGIYIFSTLIHSGKILLKQSLCLLKSH